MTNAPCFFVHGIFFLLLCVSTGKADFQISRRQLLSYTLAVSAFQTRKSYASNRKVKRRLRNTTNREVYKDIQLSEIGVGTWAWGNKELWDYNAQRDDQNLQAAFRYCVENGVNWFDTADSYGEDRRAEQLLGQFIRELPESKQKEVIVAAKLAPFPWRVGKEAMLHAIDGTLENIAPSPIGLLQLHWPPPANWQLDAYLDAFADVVKSGKARGIGLSNFGPRTLNEVIRKLAKKGVPVETLQVQFSLLSRLPIRSGLVETCRANDIKLIAYSPLCLGILSGKYTMSNVPSGLRGVAFRNLLPRAEPLFQTMREIAAQHDATPAQVAL